MVPKLKSNVAEKRLISNIYYLMIVQFVNYLLPLITLPFLTKMLSVDDFGKIILMYSIAILALVVSEFGFNITGPYYVAKNIENKSALNFFYSNVFAIKFLVSSISAISFIILTSCLSLYGYSLIELSAISVLIVTQAFQFSWYFQGIEKMKEITKATVFSKLIYFFGIVLIVPFFKNALTVIILYIFSQIILAYLYQKSLIKEDVNFEKRYIQIKKMKEIFIGNISFFISILAVIGYTMLNSMIVGAHEGLKMVAIYGLAEKIYQVALNVLSPITQAFYPYMIKNKKFSFLGFFIMLGVIFLSISVYILSIVDEIIIVFMFGEEYRLASEILNYFYFLLIIVFLSMNIGHPLLGAIGKLREVNYSVYLGGFTFMSLILFRDYSLNNLLENIIIAETTVFISRLIYVIIFFKMKYFNQV